MSRKYVYGVTLTPAEKQRIGFGKGNRAQNRSVSASPDTLARIRSWSCTVQLPDGTHCPVSYQRDGPRCHRFRYLEPVQERIGHYAHMDASVQAIEVQAQTLATTAFEQARKREQQEMRRVTVPCGLPLPEMPAGVARLRVKQAKECGGRYAVCLRFASGTLLPIGALHDHPSGALAECQRGQHGDTLPAGNRHVIGICCRWQRRWIEPRFLAERLPASLSAGDAGLREDHLEESP